MSTRTKSPTRDALLTPAEAAERCHATERQVRRWMDEQRFEYLQLPKGRRIRESVFDAWLDSLTVTPGD